MKCPLCFGRNTQILDIANFGWIFKLIVGKDEREGINLNRNILYEADFLSNLLFPVEEEEGEESQCGHPAG